MKIQKQEYLHLELHLTEVQDLIALLNAVSHATSNLPEWAKAQSIGLKEKLKANL